MMDQAFAIVAGIAVVIALVSILWGMSQPTSTGPVFLDEDDPWDESDLWGDYDPWADD